MEVRRRNCFKTNGPNGTFKAGGEKFCALFFDDILCWPATRAGELASQPCYRIAARVSNPLHFDIKGTATKQCEPNGSWFVDPETNKSWTNYTDCDLEAYSNDTALISFENSLSADAGVQAIYNTWLPVTKLICNYGYITSILTLLLCIMIFISIKKLQCARNILHIHLFISFIARALMFFVKEVMMYEGVALQGDLVTSPNGESTYITENYHWMCKLITSTRCYFIQANYMFILMEGIYLHNLMFLNLFSESSKVHLYYMFGWGCPLVFVSSWIVMRTIYDDDMCWTTANNKYIAWLTQLPIEGSVLINFVLFLSIIRVLCMKINSMYLQHKKVKYRRLIRSTLTLVLISGVPYAISVVISYIMDDKLEIIWIFCDQTFTAFQGVFMGLIYCLLNGEVKSEIRHKYQSIRRNYMHGNRKSATRTISNTLPLTVPLQFEENEVTAAARRCQYKSTEDL